MAQRAVLVKRTWCALALLCASGCTEPDFIEDSGEGAREARDQSAPSVTLDAGAPTTAPSLDSGAPDADRCAPHFARTITRPDGAYAADILVRGAGCKSGAWSARFHRAGSTIAFDTTTMNVEVSPKTKVKVTASAIRTGLRGLREEFDARCGAYRVKGREPRRVKAALIRSGCLKCERVCAKGRGP